MRILLKVLFGIIGILVLVMGLQVVASESGEVVVLTTTNAEGNPMETRLWVVDTDQGSYLRSGAGESGWYTRLARSPDVSLKRGSQVDSFRAVNDPTGVAEVNRLMAEKYGWADQYVGLLFGRENSMAVRLDAM